MDGLIKPQKITPPHVRLSNGLCSQDETRKMIIEDRYSSKDFSSVEWGAEELNTFDPCRPAQSGI